MRPSRCLLVLAVAAGSLFAPARPSFALSSYFDQLRFEQPTGWTPGDPYTTSQQWDTFTTVTNQTPDDGGTGNFLLNSNPTALAAPTLTVSGAINPTPYVFMSSGVTAQLSNYGGADGSLLPGGTHVLIQVAATVGANDPFAVTATDYSILPGTLHLTDLAGNALGGGLAGDALQVTLLDSRPNAAGFAFNVGGVDYVAQAEQWLYEFYLPDWTGDFRVTWTEENHSILEAVRVDTQVVTAAVPEPTSAVLGGVLMLGAAARRRARA